MLVLSVLGVLTVLGLVGAGSVLLDYGARLVLFFGVAMSVLSDFVVLTVLGLIGAGSMLLNFGAGLVFRPSSAMPELQRGKYFFSKGYRSYLWLWSYEFGWGLAVSMPIFCFVRPLLVCL